MVNNNKNKILFVTSAYPRYKGEERDMFIFELTKGLSNEFEIFVLCPLDKHSKSKEQYGNINVIRHPQFPFNMLTIAYGSGIVPNLKKNPLLWTGVPFYFLFQIYFINKICSLYNINCLHAHWLLPNAFSAALYKFAFNKKVKLITTLHGSDVSLFSNFFGKAIKSFTLKHTDKLSVVGIELKNQIQENFNYKNEIFVYPMGTDTNIFNFQETTKSKHKQILFVGRLIKEKGIYVLLEALSQLKKYHSDIQLHIIGEGNEKMHIQEKIKQLGLVKNIIFHGQILHSELPHYFSMVDIFVLPSFSEGFGLVLTEAMACRCITVCSNIKIFKNLIDDEINGFIIKKNTPTELATTILKIFNLSEIQKENVKDAARKKIINNYDTKITLSNYKNLYLQVLNV
jgi:glycosyltransferase involved in cell wall biosynthesis